MHHLQPLTDSFDCWHSRKFFWMAQIAGHVLGETQKLQLLGLGFIHHLHVLSPSPGCCCFTAPVAGRPALCDAFPSPPHGSFRPVVPRQPWGMTDQCLNFSDIYSFLPFVAISHITRRQSVFEGPHVRCSPDTLHERPCLLWLMDPCFPFSFRHLVGSSWDKNINSKKVESLCQFESRYIDSATHACASAQQMINANVTCAESRSAN